MLVDVLVSAEVVNLVVVGTAVLDFVTLVVGTDEVVVNFWVVLEAWVLVDDERGEDIGFADVR